MILMRRSSPQLGTVSIVHYRFQTEHVDPRRLVLVEKHELDVGVAHRVPNDCTPRDLAKQPSLGAVQDANTLTDFAFLPLKRAVNKRNATSAGRYAAACARQAAAAAQSDCSPPPSVLSAQDDLGWERNRLPRYPSLQTSSRGVRRADGLRVHDGQPAHVGWVDAITGPPREDDRSMCPSASRPTLMLPTAEGRTRTTRRPVTARPAGQ